MSWWGTLEARFERGTSALPLVEDVRSDVPRGSESGPDVGERDGVIFVHGRLRDVRDQTESPAVLAWFTKHADWCDSASLIWDLDGGPRYRYEWSDGELRKLRGVLDN